MPRVNDRRVAHKSTGGIPPKIPTPVDAVGKRLTTRLPTQSLPPPSSPSVFVLHGESIEIRARALDLRLRMDPESGSGRR